MLSSHLGKDQELQGPDRQRLRVPPPAPVNRAAQATSLWAGVQAEPGGALPAVRAEPGGATFATRAIGETRRERRTLSARTLITNFPFQPAVLLTCPQEEAQQNKTVFGGAWQVGARAPAAAGLGTR